MVAPAGAAWLPATVELTYATRHPAPGVPATPTVSIPSWTAGRLPNRCRKRTAWPLLSTRREALMSWGAWFEVDPRRKRLACAATQVLATLAAELPLSFPDRYPRSLINE